jgi:hypothetical protein
MLLQRTRTHSYTLARMRETKKGKEREKKENVHTWQYFEQSRRQQHKYLKLIWRNIRSFVDILR